MHTAKIFRRHSKVSQPYVRNIKTGTIYKEVVYKAGRRHAMAKTHRGDEIMVLVTSLEVVNG